MKSRRRQYIIDKKMQMRYTLFFILIALAGNITALFFFNKLAMEQIDGVAWSTHISITSTDELIRPLFTYVNGIIFIFVAALLFATGIFMIRKTSGPLFRMSKDIRHVADGDLSSRIILRGKDEFQDVANDLNMIIDMLHDRFSGIKDNYSEVSETLKDLKKEKGNKETLIRCCDSAVKGLDKIEAEMKKIEF